MTNDRDLVVQEILTERGKRGALAKKLRISTQAIGFWKRVPPIHAVKVGKFLGRHPHFIRPDIYPPPRKPKTSRKHASNVSQSGQVGQAKQATPVNENG